MSRVLALLWLLAVGAGSAEGTPWGWLGVRIRDLTEQEMEEISSRHGIREGFGALIVEVLPGTPAARDGLRTGDLVVAFASRPVLDTRSLQRLVAATPVGEEAVLTVLRGEGRRLVAVTVGIMPGEVLAERIAAEFGFVIRDASVEGEGPTAGPSPAPTVALVLRGSQADRAGLRPGDVIIELNGRAVLSHKAVSQALVEVSLDRSLRLTVGRGAERVGLSLDPPSRRIP